nr:uncharacterized protein LOC127490790 [Oryctolagus cuniculus]
MPPGREGWRCRLRGPSAAGRGCGCRGRRRGQPCPREGCAATPRWVPRGEATRSSCGGPGRGVARAAGEADVASCADSFQGGEPSAAAPAVCLEREASAAGWPRWGSGQRWGGSEAEEGRKERPRPRPSVSHPHPKEDVTSSIYASPIPCPAWSGVQLREDLKTQHSTPPFQRPGCFQEENLGLDQKEAGWACRLCKSLSGARVSCGSRCRRRQDTGRGKSLSAALKDSGVGGHLGCAHTHPLQSSHTACGLGLRSAGSTYEALAVGMSGRWRSSTRSTGDKFR